MMYVAMKFKKKKEKIGDSEEDKTIHTVITLL